MGNTLTRSEARVLQTIEPSGSFVYELASSSQLTPSDAFAAAERLDGRGYITLDRDRRFVKLTRDGLVVKRDISASSSSDPYLGGKRPYIITFDATAGDSDNEQPSESDVAEAIDAEIEKYD